MRPRSLGRRPSIICHSASVRSPRILPSLQKLVLNLSLKILNFILCQQNLANLMIEAIAANPNQKDYLKLASFDLFWKGVVV